MRGPEKDVLRDLNIDLDLKKNFCAFPAKASTKWKRINTNASEIQMLMLEIKVN